MPELRNTAIRGILVDAEDLVLDSDRWSLTSTGYPRRGAVVKNGDTREPRLHRIIMARVHGRLLRGDEEVDHINGNILDNRRGNLRLASHRQNMRNQQNRRRGITGYVGVSTSGNSGSYRAYLVIDGQQISAGSHSSPEEAAWMRDQWAIALHGEYARLNFDYVDRGAKQ